MEHTEHLPAEIAPGVFTLPHAVADGNNVVIVGAREAWAVDAGTYAHEGQALADFIQDQGYAPERLIYTHGHPDHVLGSEPFLGAQVIASAGTPMEIRRLLPVWARRAQCGPDALAARIAWPTLLFSHELFMNLGNLHLHLFPTPGHSQDGISIYVEEYKLLIAGDAVVTSIVPAIGDGDSVVLQESVAALAGMEIEILIPGHGHVLVGAEAVRDWLGWMGGYLAAVRDSVVDALEQGADAATLADSMADEAAFERFVGNRLPAERNNMRGRHRATVEKIVQEVLGTQGKKRGE